MTRQFTIDSLNCKGLGDPKKRKQILRHFYRKHTDIIILQETHTTADTSKTYAEEWQRLSPNHHSVWNSGTSRSCGVAILLKDKHTTPIIDSKQDMIGRTLTTQILYLNNVYQIQNIYVPDKPNLRPNFFDTLNNFTFPDSDTILGGDFNMVENTRYDRRGGTPTPTHTKGYTELQQHKQQLNLTDIWRENNLGLPAYTWFSPDKAIGSRIDRFYTSTSLRSSFVTQTHLQNPWSDHSTISLTIQLKPNVTRGAGFWKLNTTYLHDEEYIDIIKDFLTQWKADIQQDNIQQYFQDMKTQIKIITLNYAITKTRERKYTIKKLQEHVDKENIKHNPDKQYIIETQEHIMSLKQHKHEGAKIRSREQIIIDGEKPTKYFYAKEKIRKKRSTITTLRKPDTRQDDEYDKIINDIYNNTDNEDNTHTTDEQQILEQLRTYYQKLFTKQQLDEKMQDALLNNITKKLPNNIKRTMDAPITLNDIWISITLTNKNKSPGIDGLPIEFYETFWEELQQPLLALYNSMYLKGIELTNIQRISIITLIHKRNEEDDLQNWRPISLLCVDYKILSKILSLRLKTALPHIIEEEQTCGIEGRSIFDNLYQIRDTITYTNDHAIPSYILSFDFEKAFDKVDHLFLRRTLLAFGFGKTYIDFIMSSNTHCTARVSNNGRFTTDISLERGLKQGDQQSQQLYDIIAEVLAIQIRRNKDIRGIHIPGKVTDLKLSLYADDNNSFASTQQSIVHIFAELQRFEKASGCNINNSKTQGLTMGGAHVPELPFPIHWNPKEGMKILGVYFFNDPVMTQRVTWDHILNSMKRRAETMTSRTLSFRGRRIIANTLLMSKAWHVATVIPAPKIISQNINRIIFTYMYNNKLPETIKRDILTLKQHEGGVDILDFDLQQRSLRLNRLSKIVDPQCNTSWLHIPRLYTAQTILLYNTNWPFLSSPNIPKTDFQDINNAHIHIPPYFREIINFFRDHKPQFLALQDSTNLQPITTHTIYLLLLKHKSAHTPITSQTYWTAAIGRQLPWPHIWKNTYTSLYNNEHLDTHYKFLHNALPTGQRLQHGRGKYNIKCPRCHILETPKHIFTQCTFATQLWDQYRHIYTTILRIQHITVEEIVFTIKLPKPHNHRKFLLTITNIIMHEIWRARCAHKFDDIPTDLNHSTYTINSRLKHIHRTHFEHTTNFITNFCIPSPICYITPDDTLTFALPLDTPDQSANNDETTDSDTEV